jgi:hypothetical protein
MAIRDVHFPSSPSVFWPLAVTATGVVLALVWCSWILIGRDQPTTADEALMDVVAATAIFACGFTGLILYSVRQGRDADQNPGSNQHSRRTALAGSRPTPDDVTGDKGSAQ